MPRDARLRVDDMVEQVRRIERLTAGVDLSAFRGDEARIYAVAFCLIAIGESSNALPSDWTGLHPEIPWRQIRAMRNLLVHEYFRIDVEIIWRTAVERLPPLLAALEALSQIDADSPTG